MVRSVVPVFVVVRDIFSVSVISKVAVSLHGPPMMLRSSS